MYQSRRGRDNSWSSGGRWELKGRKEEEKSGASSEGDREVELLSSAVTYSKGATIDRL